MNRGFTTYFVFFFLILFQVLILKNVVFMYEASSFVYILLFLFIPIETRPIIGMLLGFLVGITIDVFYDMGGIHGASSVLLMYLRAKWLDLVVPQGGFDSGETPTVFTAGFRWYMGYAIPLIFIHHLTLFFLEAFDFSLFWITLRKVIFSMLFSFLAILLVQYIFLKKTTRS